jgi:hypothetical protein
MSDFSWNIYVEQLLVPWLGIKGLIYVVPLPELRYCGSARFFIQLSSSIILDTVLDCHND